MGLGEVRATSLYLMLWVCPGKRSPKLEAVQSKVVGLWEKVREAKMNRKRNKKTK